MHFDRTPLYLVQFEILELIFLSTIGCQEKFGENSEKFWWNFSLEVSALKAQLQQSESQREELQRQVEVLSDEVKFHRNLDLRMMSYMTSWINGDRREKRKKPLEHRINYSIRIFCRNSNKASKPRQLAPLRGEISKKFLGYLTFYFHSNVSYFHLNDLISRLCRIWKENLNSDPFVH